VTALANAGGLDRFVPRVASEWDLDAPGQQYQERDATLCFVDISGFTNLSERLAMRGRIGAEELTDVLNRVFGGMLEIAYARGGSLLKFGGDALLLQFEGPDHPSQGAAAAVEMRAALRSATRIPLSIGTARLRMSVGLHSGNVHLFRVGSRHHELIVTGPAATRTTAMEHAASAGEIFVSPELAARLPRQATRPGLPPAHVLRWQKPRLPPQGPQPRRAAPTETVEACLPAILRDHLRTGHVEFEHRIATVAFVRFQGVDELLATEGATAVATALDNVVSATQEAAKEEGILFLASDLDADGGKLILTGGVPRAQEDDAGRVLRTLRALADADLPLPLQMGVNRGHVFAGTIGATHRAAFTIIGDTVNLAARLMAAAPRGEVYASATVLDRSRQLFTATAVPPFMVKGKSQPVQAYSVGAESSARAASSEDGPFAGRADELETLADALRGGRAVTVTGDTGIGKSRLVREALTTAGRQTLTFRGEPNGTASPYRAVREAIRALVGVNAGDPATMAVELRAGVTRLDPGLLPVLPFIGAVAQVDTPPTPEVLAIEPRFRPERLADAVIRLLSHALDDNTAIVVEDAQWTDAASDALIARLVDAAPRHDWAVVVVRRTGTEGFRPVHATSIELGPLDDATLRAVVVAASAAPLRPHEVDALVRRAAGSPLVLGALLRLGAERGDVDDLPDSLEEVVAAEIDVLAPAPRLLLRYASVLGRSFNPGLWRTLLREDGIDVDDASASELEQFVRFDGENAARFQQEVVRDVAYRGLSYRRRRELHLRAGHAIERFAADAIDSAVEPLALHFFEGGDHERAWQYGRKAAAQARTAYANADAATLYRRALDAARRLASVPTDERVDTWTALGDVREQAGMLEDALDAYRKATELVGDDVVRRAGILLKRARARERSGAFVAALRELTSAERLLDGDMSDDAARVRAGIAALRAIVHQGQQQPTRALAAARRAAEEAEAAHELRELARAYGVMDWVHAVRGELEQAVYAPQIADIYRRLGEPERAATALGNHGAIQYFLGNWTEALDSYQRAVDAFARTGDVVNAAVQQSNVAELLINRGELAAARGAIVEAIRTHRAVGFVDGALFDEIQLGRLLLGEGDRDAAAATLRAVWDEAESLELHEWVLQAAIHLAECHLEDGRAADAIAVLDEAERAAGPDAGVSATSVELIRARALALDRDVLAAREHTTAGITAAREMGLRYELGLLLLLDADLADRAGDDGTNAREEGYAFLAALDALPREGVSG
jgi:class 3 adenylate cyclase/tetratricopeptide (TPR) repeat protein